MLRSVIVINVSLRGMPPVTQCLEMSLKRGVHSKILPCRSASWGICNNTADYKWGGGYGNVGVVSDNKIESKADMAEEGLGVCAGGCVQAGVRIGMRVVTPQ